MSLSDKELKVIERLFHSLTEEQSPVRIKNGLSDLFIRINLETGELSIFGDDDELIASTVIFSWVGKGGSPTPDMLNSLRGVLYKLEEQGYWEHELFEHPFSVVLVNDEFESVEELLFLDDELIKLSTPLLENLDTELSDFIASLLKEQ